MITFLRGEIVDKQPTRVVLDVGGIGYEVLIPLSSYDRLPLLGENCLVLTIDHVREDAHLLFGFMTEEEREMFRLLCAVNGIGPKLALSALSGLSVRDIKVAVVERDIKRICSISGVGKKMAERIVVELRDKISAGDALEAVAGGDGSEQRAFLRDAVLALVALGYKQDAAREMIRKVTEAHPGIDDVESIIKFALSK
jgi:Holliday junction DNA helicase RuvA